MAITVKTPSLKLTSIQDLPIEILEIIFANLPSVVDQINLSLVSQLWRQIVLKLRNYGRRYQAKRTSNKRGIDRDDGKSATFDRHIYIRLPIAGTLNDWGE